MKHAREPTSGWDKPSQSTSKAAVWFAPLGESDTGLGSPGSQGTVKQPHAEWGDMPGKLADGTSERDPPCRGQREALKPIINSPRAQAPPQAGPNHRGFRSPESPCHPKGQNKPREPAGASPTSTYASVVRADLCRNAAHDVASTQDYIKGQDDQQAVSPATAAQTRRAMERIVSEILNAAGLVSKTTSTHAALLHGVLAQQGEIVLELEACRERSQQMSRCLHAAEAQNSRLRQDVSHAAKVAEAAKQELVDGLTALKKREFDLTKEVERRTNEARDARADAERTQEINRSMLAARRGAREAISDIAQMNARLCALYMDTEQDLKQATSKHEEERRQWQGVIGELEDSLRAANQQRMAFCQLMGGMPPAAGQPVLTGSPDRCLPCAASHAADIPCVPQAAWDLPPPVTEVWCSGCMQRATPDPQVLQTTDWEQAQQLEDMEAANRKLQEENEQLRKEKQEADARASRLASLQKAEEHKQAGNVAFQQQQFAEAAEHYTEGLSQELDSLNLRAVLHTNRAAAELALGRPLDAIADCCMAASHDPGYLRLYHRRAEAYTAIEDHASASQDFMHLVQHGWQEMRAKLHEAQNNAAVRPAPLLDAYKVLGVSTSATMQQIRAAYRQLALKWHPDKAAGAPFTKAVADVIFKLLSAANAILSDPGKRRQHDFIAGRWKARHAQHWNYNSAPFGPGGMGTYCHYPHNTPFGQH